MRPSASSRREFLAQSCAALAAGGLAEWVDGPPARAADAAKAPQRVGAVAYAFQYSLGLFSYKDRRGPRMDAAGFVEATHAAGGRVAQIYGGMLHGLDETALKGIRRRAAEIDIQLEVHGGGALAPTFERTMQQAAVLGARVIGCSFGMLTRPQQIDTLEGWKEHTDRATARLQELTAPARSLGLTIGVENHLDFTVAELVELIQSVNSPQVGVLFDVGNTVGTLDEPCAAAEALGPYTVATHYKDFAIEEVSRGFRFTMVPLGAGSLQLPEITRRLLKHLRPEASLSIEMMNGQQFEVPWLLDHFWSAHRPKPARQIAAVLRHIRGKAIDLAELRPQDEIDRLSQAAHMELEAKRITRCIAQLKQWLEEAGDGRSNP